MELHPAIPEATRSRGSPALLPPSRRGGPKRQSGMETGPCLGWQVNPLPACLTFPMALTQQNGAPELEGQANGDVGEGPSRVLPRTSQSAPCIMTALVNKKRRLIVIGNSLLRGTEAQYADQTHPTGKSAATLGPRLGILLGSSWSGVAL